MEVSIRQAHISDHAAIAFVCGAAFFNEDLFGRVMHPHRHTYPNDVNLFWLRRLRSQWWDWKNYFLVATVRNDMGREEVVGVAVWQRQGEGGKALEGRGFGFGLLAKLLTTLYSYLSTYTHPNRAADPSKTNLLDAAIPFSKHHWSGPRAENWYLDLLATHPAHQRRGIGKQLVAWGIGKAEKGKVYISVMSSAGNEGWYLRQGFEEIVGWATEGEGNPLKGVEGGAILF
ncbi:hypothetical protein K432DRAFT_326402, partial [Lepidopterella palustris CBS 459.81]